MPQLEYRARFGQVPGLRLKHCRGEWCEAGNLEEEAYNLSREGTVYNCMKNNRTTPSLLFCLLMDGIGMATYTIPVLAESADIIWAPLSAFIFWRTFGGWKGLLGGGFAFLEELLPGTDLIPSFTMAWVIREVFSRKGAKPQEHKKWLGFERS